MHYEYVTKLPYSPPYSEVKKSEQVPKARTCTGRELLHPSQVPSSPLY